MEENNKKLLNGYDLYPTIHRKRSYIARILLSIVIGLIIVLVSGIITYIDTGSVFGIW